MVFVQNSNGICISGIPVDYRSTFIQTHCMDNIVLVKSIFYFLKAPAGIPMKKLLRQANGLAYWNPGSELNVSTVCCLPTAEVKRTSHPKRALAPLQGASATIEDADRRLLTK